jgi:hypothetical protein
MATCQNSRQRQLDHTLLAEHGFGDFGFHLLQGFGGSLGIGDLTAPGGMMDRALIVSGW